MSDNILDNIINQYCREPGVRGLEKQIKKIMEKVAFSIVSEDCEKLVINEENLPDLIGLPKFSIDRFYKETPIV